MSGNKITNNGNFSGFLQYELIERLDIIIKEVENLQKNYELTKEIQETFKNLLSIGSILKEKINDFTDVYAIDKGLKSLKFENINIIDLIKQVKTNVSTIEKQKNVIINIFFPENENIIINGNIEYLRKLFEDVFIKSITVAKKKSTINLNLLLKDNYIDINLVGEGIQNISDSDIFFAQRFIEIHKGKILVESKNENIGSIYIKLPLLKNLPASIEPFNKDFTITLMNEEIEVPSLSPIAMKVISVAFQEDVSVNQLTDIVKIDPLLTTKILKVVNSSIFSHKQKITTLTRAVSILGMNVIKNIALCISILESFPFTNIGGFDYRKFWELSLCSALICRFTAREFNRKLEEEAFMAGLLQNIGSLVLAKHFPFKYSEIIESYFHKNYDITELEINEWGIDHTNMGNMLLKKWNFPDIFTNIVLYHHNPEKITENISYVSDIAWLVNLSDKVVKFLDSGNSKYIEDAKENYLTRFNIKSKQLDKIIAYVSSNVGIIAKDFNLNIEYDVNYTEMLLRANVQLGKITLSLEQANRELKKVITEKIELTEKLKSANEKLAHQAVTDGLTGIFNHRFFYEVLNKRFSEARRHNYPLSCIMADIDYFKIFNDTFGHRAGDEVLLKVATIIKNTVRNEDIVARYGGEEFIILLPETDKEKAKLVAERIRENIENEKFLDKLSKGEVTISFGVATYTKEKNWTSPNSLVKESDKALYLAKRNGRNRVEIV